MNSNAFLLQAIKHPFSVGAVTPSSQNLTNLMIQRAELSMANAVVELGPGSGSFTYKIIDQLDDGVSYLGIERNESFAGKLADKLGAERIAQGSAEELSELLALHNIKQCNRIISGLPWAVFSGNRQDKILSQVANSLSEDGRFLTYAYFPFNLFLKGRAFQAKLQKHFEVVEKTEMVLNFPPAFVYICSKPISSASTDTLSDTSSSSE